MLIFIIPQYDLNAQRKKKNKVSETSQKEDKLLSAGTFSGMKFRNLGPAFMSGRISDIAIHPDDENVWYVAMGSAGVFKTENAGTTWSTLFDKESVYSVGCLTIDPNNSHTIWLGSGENVGGRHVGFGDGIYRSKDDGKSWENMGLKKSEHISEIIVHPSNANIIWVAVQGSLWSKGGERGLYKSTDGGKTWKETLIAASDIKEKEWTGVTEIELDPENPDILYAATWQRHRTVAAYMGGGPGTGLYRSVDGGETWEKLKSGLPSSNMGKIGLALSPQNSDVLYAAIELERRTGAVYRSENKGISWTKMSETVSGGTGPHYYQELYACPHNFDRIYLADVRMQISDDGGKNFRRMNEKNKHSDNHALAFRESDPDYLLVGSDGGLYESFDLAQTWKFYKNLPTIQYYKVAVDDAEPFYNVYGGTQDNNSHGGPSRTDNIHGIRNADWFVTLWGDGHQPAVEPGNPDIAYAEWQQGNLVRIDRTTGEFTYIKPTPEKGADYERYNWDAPILVSPHKPTRLYFASQRVWKSENRGDSWEAISDDLTKNLKRIEQPIMGGKKGWDEAWDIYAMSNFSSITSLSESPVQEDLLYAGTDDGIIQISNNGGDSWTKVNVSSLPGCPSAAFVNDIKADLHDANVVYVCLDNHKAGDFKPYVYKSVNKGKTWQSIKGDLPETNLAWRLVQDHVNKDLLFLGTEFGVYFSVDGGKAWVQLKGGMPTIPARDLAIQKRENDLVVATFGRGFYVLDDYSALRNISKQKLEEEAVLFASRPAWWYMQQRPLGGGKKANQGHDIYIADNPEFGAMFTYYLKDGFKTAKDIRKEAEKKAKENNQTVSLPDWDALDAEQSELKPQLFMVIEDAEGNFVRRLYAPSGKGVNRMNWDLTYPAVGVISSKAKPKTDNKANGFMAAPGMYKATLYKQINGETTKLSETIDFEVKQMRKGAIPAISTPEELANFWRSIEDFQKKQSATNATIRNAMEKLDAMRVALNRASVIPGDLDKQLFDLRTNLLNVERQLSGSKAKSQVGEKNPPSIGDRVWSAVGGTAFATHGASDLHKENFRIAQEEFAELESKLSDILYKQMPKVEKAILKAGAPFIEGQTLPIGE